MTKNDQYASKVSQSGPFYDGRNAERAETGSYADYAAEGGKLYAQQSYHQKINPFANVRSGR